MRRPEPVSIGAHVDLDDFLHKYLKTVTDECNNWSRRAHDWGTWAVALAILSALGSGAAGAAVAATSQMNGTEKGVVVTLAFIGAVLGGVAAAVGAPSQAKDASLKGDQLASLERWVSLAIIEVPNLSKPGAHERIRELLAWRDQIFGIATPAELRSGVDKKDGSKPPSGGAS